MTGRGKDLGNKRHLKVPAIRRLARRGGVRPISSLIYEGRNLWCIEGIP